MLGIQEQATLASVKRAYDEARKAGKTASEIHELMIPGSKTFLGAPEQIAPYQRSIADSTRNINAALRRPSISEPGTVEPRRPGESIADYQKRTAK